MIRWIRTLMLPLIAVAAVSFAAYHVSLGYAPQPKLPPPVTPSRNPYGNSVAGAGIIEPQTENIAIGSQMAGVAVEVLVKVGEQVTTGKPLFRLDDRMLRAELELRKAALELAQAQLKKLEQMPRPEEMPAYEARVREAEANLADQENQFRRYRQVFESGAGMAEEMTRREKAFEVAKEQLRRAKADFALMKAGAWEPEKAIARATVSQAEAQLRQTQTDLDRLTVRALVEGEVLQVNVRPGEFVGAQPGQSLIILGNLRKLHVRVDIDEHDIPRFRPNAPAQAQLRGDSVTKFPLTFVRVEPYVIPKRSLTGDNSERVDTRVLQVIYALDPRDRPLYVGQQVDVYIDLGAAPSGGAPATATAPR